MFSWPECQRHEYKVCCFDLAGSSECELCNAGTYSINYPSFLISSATCHPEINQEYFERNFSLYGYPTYQSADNIVLVWLYNEKSWTFGSVSDYGTSPDESEIAYATCQTTGCRISSASQWSEFCSSGLVHNFNFSSEQSSGKPVSSWARFQLIFTSLASLKWDFIISTRVCLMIQ